MRREGGPEISYGTFLVWPLEVQENGVKFTKLRIRLRKEKIKNKQEKKKKIYTTYYKPSYLATEISVAF